MPAASPRRGRGRPAGDSANKADLIVDAARRVFAEEGYDKASLRGIARAAGVDPALVHHYFDGKEALFVAAMELPVHPAEVLPALFAGAQGPDEIAERMVRFILSIWRDAGSRAPFLALLRSATGSETGAAMMRQFVSQALIARVAEHLPPAPDRELRVNLAAAHVIGVMLMRYVLRVEPLASADEEDVVARLLPAISAYFRG